MSEDPLAAEREQRRREREQRRQGGSVSTPAPPPATPPPPPAAPPSRPAHPRKRRLLGLALLGLGVLGLLAIGALAYRHFHRSTPPPVVLKTVTVTIPEGYTRAQTAALAREDGLRGSYLKASEGHEGFLFPDTFELDRHAPASELVQRQLEDFKRRVRGVDLAYARSKNLTLHDVVTIASMIEHEAATEKDRPLVAAVIYNRLREGMPLGIDATIRFATGNYTRPLTESELAVDSPYNTRTNAGLPPGPIDSPGLASIEAAAHPAKVDYLFYVTKPGTCGGLAFATTEAEFEADAARYDSAREAAGGNSPDTCGE
jgi:cell division protein YceG involved in septum cleavage